MPPYQYTDIYNNDKTVPILSHFSNRKLYNQEDDLYADFCSRFNRMNDLYCCNSIIVQNVVAITTLKFGWQQNEIVIEFQLQWKQLYCNGVQLILAPSICVSELGQHWFR